MLASDHVQLSWAQVDDWQAEVEALQKKIAAAKVLLPARIGAKARRASGRPTQAASGNYMGTVVEIANSVLEPITKDEMSRRLEARGFSGDKLKGTLNVVLYKTKSAKRITYENGMISGVRKP